MDLEKIRRDYALGSLQRAQLSDSPHRQFELWLQQAIEADLNADPTAMTLATVNQQGVPSQRVVLLKGHDEDGLRFFTSKGSRKGQELALNRKVSAHFSWLPLERQVEVKGEVSPLTEQQNDAYFKSRPKASQVGALVSHQSQPIDSRKQLDEEFTRLMEHYADTEVPRPEQWGGYLIRPTEFEFWQGGRNRLHDRFVYTLAENGWQVQRLQP
ncbi:pyridoxamine 5'-phosphate oxidase [Idiomarina seosinensis]|uniref:pyridoxamine 5'-phosphate oxidase n=1 Tax=Idiomarina seosinensis TaxID=281739 RepID=UPI00384AB15F